MIMTEQEHPGSVRIADLCDEEKPREKALAHGIRTLSDIELLALLLGGGVPGKSVIELSRELYTSCDKSLSAIAAMSIRDMCKRYHGIGPAKAITIAAALELGARRKDIAPARKPKIVSSKDAYEHLRGHVENLAYEEFWVLMLSRAAHVIGCECVSRGGTAATVVEPKMVFKHAIDQMASSIIVAHNHPSGNLVPSGPDDQLTRKLRESGKMLEIPVLDHLIIGPEGYYSYADNGNLP